MSYTPDHHLNVTFDFKGEYSAPDALNVVIDFDDQGTASAQYLNPVALDSPTFGELHIKTAAWTISFSGFSNQTLGIPTVNYLNRHIIAVGVNSFLSGQAKIENTARVLKPVAQNFLAFGKPSIKSDRVILNIPGVSSFVGGKPRISFARQIATTVSKVPFTFYGKPSISHGVRYLEQTQSPLFTRYGSVWLSHSPRYIEPRGIFELFPSRHQIGTSRSIQIEGFDALRFGTRIIPESQSVYPLGFSTLFGDAKIENHKQFVFLKGFLTYGTELQHRFGYSKVWNSNQHIKTEDNALGPIFGNQLNIINRNRTIQTYGQPQTQFGYARLDNNARLVGPQGIPSPIEVEKTNTMVAYRIRSFKMQGIEPPYITSRHILHLGAKVITQQGKVLTLFGQTSLVNTRRYYTYIGLGEQSLFGRPMISAAVRQLRIESDYSIHPPVIPLPIVRHGRRFIEMAGLDSVRYGDAYVVSKFTKATPRWNHIERVGEPVIRNVTPEVRIWGIKDDLYGKPYIGHYTRELKPQGLNAQIFGRARIADSTQQINLNGFGLLSEQMNRLHEVKNLQTDDYLPRKIQPKGITTINFGQSPKINLNGITPQSERPMTLFGNTRVIANTIRVEPGYWEILIGKPTIDLANRSVKVAAGLNFMAFGIPRLSPHTIYAVVESSEQARRNHVNPGQLHYVDGWDSSNGRPKEPGVEFGRPSVTHKQRFLQGVGVVFSLFGDARIKNAQGFIRPSGLNTMRFGVLGPMGTQEIRLRNIGQFTLFGHPSIKSVIRPDPYIRPTGMRSTGVGRPSVDYFNRSIRPVGFDAMRVGTKKNDDRPYMWQGLRIGSYVPTNIGGNVHTLFGQGTWISFKVREIRARGEDFSHVNEYDPHNFKQRMYIWNRTQPQLPSAQIIGPQGFDNFITRIPGVKPSVHYIRPVGNMDNYRKGGL